MSCMSWGTMRKVLREAEHALAGANKAHAAQKLAKAVKYINAAHRRVTKEPRRFAERDIEKLQQVVKCLRGTNLGARVRREDLSGRLAGASGAVKAIREAVGS